jgi:hypothetical protein
MLRNVGWLPVKDVSVITHPSKLLWRYGNFWALVSLTRRLHSSLSSARLHPLIPRTYDVSLQTTSSHLFLVFPVVRRFGNR